MCMYSDTHVCHVYVHAVTHTCAMCIYSDTHVCHVVSISCIYTTSPNIQFWLKAVYVTGSGKRAQLVLMINL